MINFRYDDDETAFVDAAIERFAKANNFEAITRIQQCTMHLEEACISEARLYPNEGNQTRSRFNPQSFNIEVFMARLGRSNGQIKLAVPLNSLAVLCVLFDLMISPERVFQSANKIFNDVLKQDIEIRDERDEVAFDVDVAKKVKSEEGAFFRLFDQFITKHGSLLADSSRDESPFGNLLKVMTTMEELFDSAAHEVARPIVQRIQGELGGGASR